MNAGANTLKNLKGDLQKNLEAKLALIEKIQEFGEFNSESIKDWNEKTKEIRVLQSEWEAVGGMPREHAKEVNKKLLVRV